MNILEPAPTPLDLHFRLFDTAVRVSGWFWVLPGLIGFAFLSSFGVGFFFIVTGCVFLSILLHEFGHVFAGRRFGADSYVVLNGIGGVAVGCAEVPERWQRIFVFLAGPLAQLLLGGTLWLASDLLSRSLLAGARPDDPLCLSLMVLEGINLGWPLFNLLPIWPMDGWQIAREFVGVFLGRNRAPWEQDANWWKQGSWNTGSRSFDPRGEYAFRSRLPVGWIAVVAVVLVIGWAAFRVHKNRLRQEAFAELQKLGAVAGWDHVATFYGFNFRQTNVGDQQLALLEVFDEIDDVDLAGTRVTDAGLRHLSGLRRLKMVYLQNTQVTDAGLSHLRSLTDLELLHLSGTKVTDSGLEHLRPLRKLEWLSLSRTRVTDAGLAHIKTLPRLRVLHVYDSQVSHEGITDLKEVMPSLVINPTGDEDA